MKKSAEKISYWKLEEPEVLSNKALKVELYEEAGALQLKMRGRDEKGESYVKRGVYLRKHILQKNPELLKNLACIFADWHDEILQKQEEGD